MRTIIAGSRGILHSGILTDALASCGWRPTVVLSGTARGADLLGEAWAKEHGVPCERFPAEWDQYGKSAGYKRNVQMAEQAEALIALWDGKSKGTKHMIDIARSKGLRVHTHIADLSVTERFI